MPTEPIREQIAAYIAATLLPKITTKGNTTYWNDIGKISRIAYPYDHWSDSDLPVLTVSMGLESKETRTTQDIYADSLMVEINFYCRYDENELDLDTYASRAAHDIETAMFTDQQMNSLAVFIRSVNIDAALDWDSRAVLVTSTFTLEYRHTTGSP